MTTELRPHVGLITSHLLLIATVEKSSRLKLELAWGLPEHGPCHARCFSLHELSAAAAFAASINAQGCNVYLGVTLKASTAPAGKRTSNRHAALATVLAIDVDDDLVRCARRLPPELRPRLLTVTGRQPTLRGHFWFQLRPTSELELFEEAVQRAVEVCGGDAAARGRARVMRLAGTVSYPSEAKVRRGYAPEVVAAHFVASAAYDVRDILNILPPPIRPAPRPTSAAPSQGTPAARLSDVISALSSLPKEYAEDYPLWLRTGFALHDFDAGPAGLDLWTRFSFRCPVKASSTDFEARWATFGRQAHRPITVRWLLAQARTHGWSNHAARHRSRGG